MTLKRGVERVRRPTVSLPLGRLRDGVLAVAF